VISTFLMVETRKNRLWKPCNIDDWFEADSSKYIIYLIGYDEHERYCSSRQ